ncbi:MAG: ATP-binding protein [Akkermansiaceae bacterium]
MSKLRHLQQLKRQEEVRAEALGERDQLLDALSDAFLLVNETSQIVFANKKAQSLLKGRQLVGRSIMEAFLDDQLSIAIMKCIRTGKPMKEGVTLKSAYTPLGAAGEQGVSSWIIDAAPLKSNGDATMTRVVIRDVTLEYQADQVRRDFVANASHELRTPMAIINGYLENLLEDDIVDDPVMARKFLTTMNKHGQRISMLVEDMLVISRMESGDAMTLNKKMFSIKDCVQDVCDRLESVIASQSAKVELLIDPPELQVFGDRFYWVQIMFNLIENALKQNPTLSLHVVVKAQLKNDIIKISVCDDGIGIPSADLPYIFKRFYRVEKHHSQTNIKGTGLGLSIVRRAIEAHGGNIEATSKPGQKTCFNIKLPNLQN